MKYLLRLSLAFALVIGALAAIGLLLPRTYRIERSAVIEAPPSAVGPLVNDLARWREWGIWFERDPRLAVRFSAQTIAAGAWMEWRSASQGNGRLELLQATPEAMQYRLSFEGTPLQSRGTIKLVGLAGGSRTIVTWCDEGNLGFSPVTRWFGLWLDRLIGPDFERGLALLKARVERGSPRP